MSWLLIMFYNKCDCASVSSYVMLASYPYSVVEKIWIATIRCFKAVSEDPKLDQVSVQQIGTYIQ